MTIHYHAGIFYAPNTDIDDLLRTITNCAETIRHADMPDAHKRRLLTQAMGEMVALAVYVEGGAETMQPALVDVAVEREDRTYAD